MILTNIRNQIVNNKSLILIPFGTIDFFTWYAKEFGSTSSFCESSTLICNTNKLNRNPIPTSGSVLFYSGGAESLLGSSLRPDLTKITLDTISYDKAHQFLKDEFYLAEYALNKNYADAYLGIEKISTADYDKFEIEFRPEFITMWNKTFKTRLHSLVQGLTKFEVYQQLFDLGYSIEDINVGTNTWKLFEKSLIGYHYGKCNLLPDHNDFVLKYKNNLLKYHPFKDTIEHFANLYPDFYI